MGRELVQWTVGIDLRTFVFVSSASLRYFLTSFCNIITNDPVDDQRSSFSKRLLIICCHICCQHTYLFSARLSISLPCDALIYSIIQFRRLLNHFYSRLTATNGSLLFSSSSDKELPRTIMESGSNPSHASRNGPIWRTLDGIHIFHFFWPSAWRHQIRRVVMVTRRFMFLKVRLILACFSCVWTYACNFNESCFHTISQTWAHQYNFAYQIPHIGQQPTLLLLYFSNFVLIQLHSRLFLMLHNRMFLISRLFVCVRQSRRNGQNCSRYGSCDAIRSTKISQSNTCKSTKKINVSSKIK